MQELVQPFGRHGSAAVRSKRAVELANVPLQRFSLHLHAAQLALEEGRRHVRGTRVHLPLVRALILLLRRVCLRERLVHLWESQRPCGSIYLLSAYVAHRGFMVRMCFDTTRALTRARAQSSPCPAALLRA